MLHGFIGDPYLFFATRLYKLDPTVLLGPRHEATNSYLQKKNVGKHHECVRYNFFCNLGVVASIRMMRLKVVVVSAMGAVVRSVR